MVFLQTRQNLRDLSQASDAIGDAVLADYLGRRRVVLHAVISIDVMNIGQPVTGMLAVAQASNFVNGFVVTVLARAILLEASGPK